MGKVLEVAQPACLQFTGSSAVAEKLIHTMHGRLYIEDAGFDPKILGPDVMSMDSVAWQCDQDAYALSGQKCSAQSILFAHENWIKAGIIDNIKAIAAERTFDNMSIGPVLSHTTENMLAHKDALCKIPGAKVLFGGKALTGHSVPTCYGMIEPTAVFVPLDEILKPENFALCTTEIFGPFQVVTEYKKDEEDKVIEACERMTAHLTMAVVSNDMPFLHKMLGATVNGTTYGGINARTTGAPEWHFFGPAGTPLAAGIGTIDAIRLVWSSHREVLFDLVPPTNFVRTPPS
ncbi:hypothetical protein KIPB_012888 [Kipferlia bialata]|uniref:Aldehyde dehydrogenase domain-containing protein n=1 Tax=Kipferlia bialata TaxID=797122 RepID=A0A9K3D8I4_9EUKA|nr:hypothetical protein KIPB_012888 [Kipferlia bialata]|eukprot:g12888.t1